MSAAPSLPGLDGYSIVYFGNDWAAENRTSSHHIAKRLAARFPLLYVDSPGLRAPQGTGRDLRKIFAKLGQAVRAPQQIGAHFWRCTVPQIPFRGAPGVTLANHAFSRLAVRRAMRAVGFGKRILWFAVPHPGFLAGSLGEDLVVYYCIDDYAAHPGVDPIAVREMDDALTKRADRLFVAPPALVDAKRLLNASATYSPHGVDSDLFGLANLDSTPVAPGASALPKPLIGFFGSVADWIDVPLIAELAASRPAYTILLVGHVATNVDALRALPNVHLVGPQKYESLPMWAKAFDVAIIPYRRNQQVQNANPLKLREYLATGRPIVSVASPEIEKFATVVSIASDNDDFVRRIDAALAADSPTARLARIDSVRHMTWDARVSEAVAVVDADLTTRMLNGAHNRIKTG